MIWNDRNWILLKCIWFEIEFNIIFSSIFPLSLYTYLITLNNGLFYDEVVVKSIKVRLYLNNSFNRIKFCDWVVKMNQYLYWSQLIEC